LKRRSPSRMIWMVLPETLILLTSRAATPMVDSSSIGGTSMDEDFWTTRPMNRLGLHVADQIEVLCGRPGG